MKKVSRRITPASLRANLFSLLPFPVDYTLPHGQDFRMASSGALEADLGEYEQHNDHHQCRLASSPIAQYFYLVLEALDELGETEARGDLSDRR